MGDDRIGVCGECKEWADFINIKEEERKEKKMKKLMLGLGILLLSGCGLAKVDKQQNEDLGVIVQAHNALVEQVNKVTKATDTAFGSNVLRRQDLFRAGIATPTPTPAGEE